MTATSKCSVEGTCLETLLLFKDLLNFDHQSLQYWLASKHDTVRCKTTGVKCTYNYAYSLNVGGCGFKGCFYITPEFFSTYIDCKRACSALMLKKPINYHAIMKSNTVFVDCLGLMKFLFSLYKMSPALAQSRLFWFCIGCWIMELFYL